jgi:hypothetical protein
MPRNRIIYQSLALFAGQNNAISGSHAATGIKQLTRVQSWDSDFSRSFTDVNQYGQLAAIDRVEIEAPTVNMSTSWYPTDGSNERYVGLSVYKGANETSILSGILSKATDMKNYFLLVREEGSDANLGGGGTSGVFGIGNAFLTSYSLEGSVGDIPTANADFEGFNFRIYTSGSGHVPAVDPVTGIPITNVSFALPATVENDSANQPKVLRPGDITVDITGSNGFSESDLKIQSFNISVDLSRSPIEKLGSRFPFSREIDFPLNATMSVEAVAGDLEAFNLADLLCETGTYNLSVTMRQNSCSGNGAPALVAVLKGAKLTSESVSTSIGDNANVSLEYEVSIGSATDLARGIFLSGSYA